ncbi:hypothetical protein JZ751_029875 [Albula glossodonta]|uniref:Snurportin-1 n=1 Tax=Albula glossodonta TaxID=121402 RepID=A0A8T2NAZ1_9TELE|nr:hypothetical protein JZ751_029875 [Albula glossodonta]
MMVTPAPGSGTFYCKEPDIALGTLSTGTEFRFFWLQSKVQEEEGLSENGKRNPYRFLSLQSVVCSTEGIQKALAQEYSFKVDGLLFYHRQTHYTPGSTPLVGWLRPYMVTDILGLQVPDCPLTAKPAYASHQLQQILENKKTSTEVRPANQSGGYELEYLSTPECPAADAPQPIVFAGFDVRNVDVGGFGVNRKRGVCSSLSYSAEKMTLTAFLRDTLFTGGSTNQHDAPCQKRTPERHLTNQKLEFDCGMATSRLES